MSIWTAQKMLLLWGLIGAGLLFGAATSDTLPEINEDQIQALSDGAAAEIPIMDSPQEVDQVFLTVHDVAMQKESERHRQEKEQLLQRFERRSGKWDASHPRHRLLDAMYGFQKYFDRNVEDLNKWRRFYKKVSNDQKKLLEKTVKYSSKFTKVEHRLAENDKLCQAILDKALEFYGIERSELDEHIQDAEGNNKAAEKVSVSQALKHLVRDWSDEGVGERGDAFPCLLKTIDGLFPERTGEDPVKLLLPGAGLGRLGHELAGLSGFEVTNNEWSMYMNIVYRFVENLTTKEAETVYPFVDYWSHHVSTPDMMRQVAFPDKPVNATNALLVEGDFTKVFTGREGTFDAVVTHFFIDTARNLMAYLETIHGLLPQGGHWVNFGPLLYGTGPYVQLSLEEVLSVAEAMGFEFLETGDECGEVTVEGKMVRGLEAVYGFNEKALTRNAYQAQFWVARKKS